jgi:AcrR family transcriptional regulator
MGKQLMRADAQRSYDRILEAAGTVIAHDGANASLEEIARTAGVGSATLHRHFASRWDLLDAVFADRVDKICAEAERSMTRKPPEAALTDWLRLLTVESARNRGLAASMFRGRPDDRVSDDSCHAKIQGAGQLLLTNAVAAGEVRPDAALADLLRLVSAIVLSTDGSSSAAADSATMIDLVLEGIHARTQ